MKLPTGKWQREHHYVWEAHGNAPAPKGYVLHHKDEDKENNRYTNLELLTRGQHAKLHGKCRTVSEETRAKMRDGAARRVADPAHRASLSDRAKRQHASGKLGRATWKPGSSPDPEVMRQHGLKQADRLRQMAKTISSEEMRRRSYQRKMFKGRTE